VALLGLAAPASPSLPHDVALDDMTEVRMPDRFVKTRLSHAEYEAFSLVLLKLSTNAARFLRKVIREVIGAGPDLLANDLQALREATYQVGAVGRNLNQLVRFFHSGRLAGVSLDRALLMAVRDEVAKLEKELLAVVQRSRRRWVNHG